MLINKNDLTQEELKIIRAMIFKSSDTIAREILPPTATKEEIKRIRAHVNNVLYAVEGKLARIETLRVGNEELSLETIELIIYLKSVFQTKSLSGLRKIIIERDAKRKKQLALMEEDKEQEQEEDPSEEWPGDGNWGLFFSDKNMEILSVLMGLDNGGNVRSSADVAKIVFGEDAKSNYGKVKTVCGCAFFDRSSGKASLPIIKRLYEKSGDKDFFKGMPPSVSEFCMKLKETYPCLRNISKVQDALIREREKELCLR